MTKKKKIVLYASLALLFVLFTVWMVIGNRAVTVTEYRVESEKLPEAFSGLRIAQISDLHNATFGKENRRLLSVLKETGPDIIVLTGDMIDSHRTNVDVAADFAAEASLIAPTFYITGNHEAAVSDEYADLKVRMIEAGVVVLENEKTVLKRDGQTLNIVGLLDPQFEWLSEQDECEEMMEEELEPLVRNDLYDIVLVHRPQYFEVYAESEGDLFLSGHMHGGQFRLPFLGGLYAPSQGFFPKYDAGVFTENGVTMVISRGLGNSRFPIRFNNPPEIVVVDLVAK